MPFSIMALTCTNVSNERNQNHLSQTCDGLLTA